MRETMLGCLAALAVGAVEADTMADELIKAARVLDGEPVAEAMRLLARCNRVETLRLQGQLGAMTVRYRQLFDDP